ncbi:MBL fold metallo-hydrolase [Pontibacter qinzhouensis]|uniref:MBL fold metallo-hydrolase n=1 Tax=Pontibacter qinzhouensis TaxID=2603253 RepID=A0A5C8IVB2_9BACT|nr:MBL fold metallo-hydrolase [Pontibacter qinzhouensis]TXK24835.1 MBL fold metallo-hydrolase [Pontibacter qinzhouensis]
MAIIHFLNVLEGDCNIIQHNSGRLTVIDVSNAYNDYDTDEERKVKVSREREDRRLRTMVPSDKVDYKQKLTPDNPILYIKEKIKKSEIFRFIITHPDMDHLDGIEDLFTEFNIINVWDTNNRKEISNKLNYGGYNIDDWKFYKNIRDGKKTGIKRLTYFANRVNSFYKEDNIKILSPTPKILEECNRKENWNDSSYVFLYSPPMANGKSWKILFAGDSEDVTWEYILENFKEEVTNVDVLFAPHHGRDSGRSYEFLKTLKPRVTLFGNASSKHLAYDSYKDSIRITNNQAGYVVLDISGIDINFYVKNYE